MSEKYELKVKDTRLQLKAKEPNKQLTVRAVA